MACHRLIGASELVAAKGRTIFQQNAVREVLFIATPILQAAAVAGTVVFCTFYLAPEQLVLGTKASLAAFVTPFVVQLFPHSQRLWQVRIWYFRLLSKHLVKTFAASALVTIILCLWGATMFSEIRRRYEYLDRIDEAIKLVNADEVGVPRPDLLANAFENMPHRPEVPFILARAVRILSPDDQLGPFHEYMKRFLAAVDREKVAASYAPMGGRARFSVERGANLPILQPIELIVQYSLEVPATDRTEHFSWAISKLTSEAEKRDDFGLKIYKLILETDRDVRDADDANRRSALDKAISLLESAKSELQSRETLGGSRLMTDQLYQELLDALGDLNLKRALHPSPTAEKIDPSQCLNQFWEKAIDNFSHVLLLRRRLLVRDEILWWRPPSKLTIYHIFAHLSGQRAPYAEKLTTEAEASCPKGWEKIKALHSSPAYRSFQDPDQWSMGTPLAPAFNGSAAAAQLRKWLQAGW
jgi:hypothetical protein